MDALQREGLVSKNVAGYIEDNCLYGLASASQIKHH
jgi:hypothetical protein